MAHKRLKILFASAEVSPFAKTGGLADVAGSLPKELSQLGHDVRIVMPRYGSINIETEYVCDVGVAIGDRTETCIIKQYNMSDGHNGLIPVYLIENYHYYNRPGIYCYHDDGERFILLCKTVLEMLPALDYVPDIIHCNDWHTGPICLLLKEKYNKIDLYKNISTVYTIHNLEYQGNFGPDILRYLNLETDFFTSDKAEFYGMFSFMKCGLVYADVINTVSKQYAKEILTPAYGERMEGILQYREKDLYGIVNGISYSEFDPENNRDLYVNYNSSSVALKSKNKEMLRKELGLPASDGPLCSIVTRLSSQKGLELLLGTIDELIEIHNLQLIVLGLGDDYYQNSFTALQKKYPGNVAAFFEFNNVLAHKIYASADIFLMPSRFEPCGLGQIISLRYGTIPVVRATGGLAETIIDFDEDIKNSNGFKFYDFSVKAFKKAFERAIEVYANNSCEWEKLIVRALESDFSWKHPCKRYLDIYYKAIENNQ